MWICTRIVRLLAFVLGSIGFAACLAMTIAIWIVGAEFGKATEHVFREVDASVAELRDRLSHFQSRVDAAKLATSDLEGRLRDWVASEKSKRDRIPQLIADKTELLDSSLEQANHWLEVVESSATLVQRSLTVGGSTGFDMETGLIDEAVQELASLRARVSETRETVAGIRKRTGVQGDDIPEQAQVREAVQLAVRAATSLDAFESRIELVEDRLVRTQSRLRVLKSSVLKWVHLGTIGATLLAMWLAIGQLALCILAWPGSRRSTD